MTTIRIITGATNVHYNAPVWITSHYRRPTHKQQITIQTETDKTRHGVRAFYGWGSRLDFILSTQLQDA